MERRRRLQSGAVNHAPHVIWDWNGTLVDDLELVVAAVNLSLEDIGATPIDADLYRTHYTRPVELFYERLLGRPLEEREWRRIDRVFHEGYREGVPSLPLTGDARAAVEQVSAAGWTQSILSMWWNDELMAAVAAHGLDRFMIRVDGNRGEAGETKLRHLRRHLHDLEEDLGALNRARVVLVGDALDDAGAAREVGIWCVLYDGGSHHRAELAGVGMPIADCLTEAVEIASRLAAAG